MHARGTQLIDHLCWPQGHQPSYRFPLLVPFLFLRDTLNRLNHLLVTASIFLREVGDCIGSELQASSLILVLAESELLSSLTFVGTWLADTLLDTRRCRSSSGLNRVRINE